MADKRRSVVGHRCDLHDTKNCELLRLAPPPLEKEGTACRQEKKEMISFLLWVYCLMPTPPKSMGKANRSGPRLLGPPLHQGARQPRPSDDASWPQTGPRVVSGPAAAGVRRAFPDSASDGWAGFTAGGRPIGARAGRSPRPNPESDANLGGKTRSQGGPKRGKRNVEFYARHSWHREHNHALVPHDHDLGQSF